MVCLVIAAIIFKKKVYKKFKKQFRGMKAILRIIFVSY